MEQRFIKRLGDGSEVALTRGELRAELEEGTQSVAAAARAKLPPLEPDELEHLLDIFASAARFSAVDVGDEVVLSFDGSGTPQQGSRVSALLQYEQCLAADTCELYHIDYSYKAVKTVVGVEQQAMKEAQERLEMTRGMKLAEAKDYVAGKLGASVADLAAPLVMHEVRGELRLGRVFETETTYPDDPSPQEAKRNIAARLDLQINGAGR